MPWRTWSPAYLWILYDMAWRWGADPMFFRVVVFNCPEEENIPVWHWGLREVPRESFGKVLPHLSVVELHSPVQGWPLPHLLHIPGGLGSLWGLIWFSLQFLLKSYTQQLRHLRFWIVSRPLVVASIKVISGGGLTSTVCLIHPSIDGWPCLQWTDYFFAFRIWIFKS